MPSIQNPQLPVASMACHLCFPYSINPYVALSIQLCSAEGFVTRLTRDSRLTVCSKRVRPGMLSVSQWFCLCRRRLGGGWVDGVRGADVRWEAWCVSMEVSHSESGATVQTLAVVWKTSHLSENLTFHCCFFLLFVKSFLLDSKGFDLSELF